MTYRNGVILYGVLSGLCGLAAVAVWCVWYPGAIFGAFAVSAIFLGNKAFQLAALDSMQALSESPAKSGASRTARVER